jgi:putative ABC transport system substrate-binding protein
MDAHRSAQLAALAARHAVAMVGPVREFVMAGGLMSYGADLAEAYRLTGAMASRAVSPRLALLFGANCWPDA